MDYFTHSFVLALAQATVHVPTAPAADAPSPLDRPAEPAALSLVVAGSVAQADPQPLCAEQGCLSMFRTTWKNAQTIAGEPVREAFAARMEMGSPFISPYRLVLVVERRVGEDWLVRAARGFNTRTGEACFEDGEWDAVGPSWRPEGAAITWRRTYPCVKA